MLEKLGFSLADLRQKETTAAVAQRVAELEGQAEQLAGDLHVGLLTLRDILAQLTRPGRDPREDLPPPIFKKGIFKLEDLQPGMELLGSVLNVVDFGAFVDIGLHDSGLVHVSQLANRFVRDPHEVVSVGDIVKVWVMEIDKTRRRVSLTMIPPGTPKHEPRPRPARGEGQRSDRPQGQRPPRRGPPRQAQNQSGPAAAAGGTSAPATSDRPAPQLPAAGGPPSQGHVRPPHTGRKPFGRQQHGGRSQGPQQRPDYSRPKPKPKPLVPLSKAMKEGKEPLRTFGDLMQFYQFQSGAEPPAPPAKKPESDRPPQAAKPAGAAAGNVVEQSASKLEGTGSANETSPVAPPQDDQPQIERVHTQPAAENQPEVASDSTLDASPVDSTVSRPLFLFPIARP